MTIVFEDTDDKKSYENIYQMVEDLLAKEGTSVTYLLYNTTTGKLAEMCFSLEEAMRYNTESGHILNLVIKREGTQW